MSVEQPRYRCQHCGKYYRATLAGNLRQHNGWSGALDSREKPRCRGSGGKIDEQRIHPCDMKANA